MLSNEDKQWIKELITKQLPTNGKYINEDELKSKKTSLTLAETVQLKKLLAQRKLEEKLPKGIKQFVVHEY